MIDYFSLPHQCSSLFLVLIKHNRSFYIPDVLLYVAQLYKKREGLLDFLIQSAHELTEQNKQVCKRFLATMTGKTIMCRSVVDKTLIAGLRLQSDEYRWEYSVRKQLESLRALQKREG